MTRNELEHLHQSGFLSSLDYHFAGFMAGLSGADDPQPLFLAAALVSKATSRGDVCFDLTTAAGKSLAEAMDAEEPIVCPDLKTWRAHLEASGVVGEPGEEFPLILDEKSRLYLYRYWEYEHDLAARLRQRSIDPSPDVDHNLLMDGLARHFPQLPDEEADWQRTAALTSIIRRLCVITGGPGTGKTTTVAKVLALLLEQAGEKKVRFALAAPTGKAAARLEESIQQVKGVLKCSERVRELLPTEASTLHRLLGPLPNSPYFLHDEQNPLPVDAVIVDESSMVDLALMAKLARALPRNARLILLGDKDQLASVEAGAVLGDICGMGGAAEASPLQETGQQPGIGQCIVELRESHRFGKESGIGALSRAVKEGDPTGAIGLLKDGGHADIIWRELPRAEALPRVLRSAVLEGFRGYLKATSLPEMYSGFQSFRILCVVRRGPYGVAGLNLLTERILAEAGLIKTGPAYHGRPVMVTENDYNLKLFNGDIGFVLPHGWPDFEGAAEIPSDHETEEAMQSVRAFFADRNGPHRTLPLPSLPEHETVYAMTVHKSQGSEFDEVHLILPDRDSPVLTRELLYTGITRARKKVTLWAREDILQAAVSRRIERSSGLRDAIWG